MVNDIPPDEFIISANRSRLDLDVIHGFLSRSYWAKNIPRETVQRSVDHSLCFGVYHRDRQVGFARVISDFSTTAYVSDVFVLEPYRGGGLSKRLMQHIKGHPDLQGLRRWMLVTADAHGLYEQFGFTRVAHPERYLEILVANPYG